MELVNHAEIFQFDLEKACLFLQSKYQGNLLKGITKPLEHRDLEDFFTKLLSITTLFITYFNKFL